jgi:Domain of unknown function (DUF4440)
MAGPSLIWEFMPTPVSRQSQRVNAHELWVNAPTLKRFVARTGRAGRLRKSTPAPRDDGNLKETVLALEMRIWEAYAKQDVDVFKNLLADDFVGTDMFGRHYDKASHLNYPAGFRVIEHTLKNVKVIVLTPTSAIVSYEVDYKVRPTEGGNVESTTRRVTSAWAQRKGRWYYVYFEDKLVQKEGAAWKDLLRVQEYDIDSFGTPASPAKEEPRKEQK